eukprot:CAMPEP_0182439044 /NCGR_PEP_ID=MMETSP1167-20130531/86182_1 /TAXON_ID=2988 /ORGANISM="Mallomonas Sp, Strain CCMP3275" /LENGTH=433 /DNA_ID=CAMNT_0024632629 /DNA_START=286 /DNA_END=1587 /DNA_ORIENTATION=-
MDLNPPKGTRDFYPEDHRLKTWLFSSWRSVAESYGFEEYDAPVLETEDLYIRKAGEEVTQQLYNFEDKGGRRLSLRPEMTPSLARMVLARKNALPFPLKWFSIPQCWRYERMTRGRRREHYQWNMDIWGVEGVEAEAELLSSVVSFLSSTGLSARDVGIKVNSRKLLLEVMLNLGIPEEKFAATCVLVDKLEKVPLDSLSKDLQEIGLEKETVSQLMETLMGADLESLSDRLGDSSPGLNDLKRLFSLSESYGYSDWLVFDPSVVRGLAYYTGVVFEGFDRQGVLRAIFGGGRYDTLLTTFGGEAVAAVGFGFGDAVIVELLTEKALLPDFKAARVPVLVVCQSESVRGEVIEIVQTLRQSGVSVDMILENKKMKWVFQRADKTKTEIVLMIGEREIEQDQVTIKDMKTGEQNSVLRNDIVTTVQKILSEREK